jgi:hypothetical protein
MRKIIWSGMLGAMGCAAIFYFAARYRLGEIAAAWTSKPAPRIVAELGLEEEDAACVPDEPHPVDVLLPDPAKLTEDWQPFEPIDLLQPQDIPSPDQVMLPPAVIRSAGEVDCLRSMPTRELLPVMPRVDKTVESELDEANEEEQEEVPAESMTDPKAIQERLKRILQSYLQERNWPKRTAVDTMEFRPSDGKKGEFDRIPF